MNPNMIGDRAVVLGGSMAGLLVARVLADAYNRVTVVERDDLSDSVAPRRGVPQGRHIHGLIARGGQILDELLPGFTESLTARGVPTMDQLRDARLYFSGHRLRQADERRGGAQRQPALPRGACPGAGALAARRHVRRPARHPRIGHHTGPSQGDRRSRDSPRRRRHRGDRARRSRRRRDGAWLEAAALAGGCRLRTTGRGKGADRALGTQPVCSAFDLMRWDTIRRSSPPRLRRTRGGPASR